MFRNKRTYLILIAILFASLIALNHYYGQHKADWRVTYNINSKSPYGCYVLDSMFYYVFPGQVLERNYNSLYETLDSDTIQKKNIVEITSEFNPDKYNLVALLKFVSKGNDLFVSATNFGHLFEDTLKFKTKFTISDSSIFSFGDEHLFLLNPVLKNDTGYYYNERFPQVYISSFDTTKTLKLGEDSKGNINFICTKFGSGRIFIQTQPLVFTNYNLLNGNVEYAAKVLSYLPVRITMWDGYYKPYRQINTSPMRYVLSQTSLRTAYYLLLLTLLLYLVVESKRRQRVIPVMTPPENRSLQFVKTIGRLYFKQRDNADLVKKKIIYFREFLHERYYLSSVTATGEAVAFVSSKTGVAVEQVKELLELMNYLEKAEQVSNSAVIELNRKMKLFYEQCL
jgi:hypothetical protein